MCIYAFMLLHRLSDLLVRKRESVLDKNWNRYQIIAVQIIAVQIIAVQAPAPAEVPTVKPETALYLDLPPP